MSRSSNIIKSAKSLLLCKVIFTDPGDKVMDIFGGPLLFIPEGPRGPVWSWVKDSDRTPEKCTEREIQPSICNSLVHQFLSHNKHAQPKRGNRGGLVRHFLPLAMVV